MTDGTATWNYTYGVDGLRTSRTDGTKAYSYIYNGGTLSQMTVGSDTLTFTYDASGRPLSVSLNGTTYYYVTNLQGDVTAILSASGTAVVTYTYDAWGNPLTTTGDLATTLGTLNPLRYRGYVYDTETGLYYLQSRYYDPEIGRFLNADALVATGQGLLGNNMFAYCNNNPVANSDPTGESLLGAIIGGAIGGALISVISHTHNNPDATIGSIANALLVGAITGGLGGAAGVVSAARGVLSIAAGIVAGIYAGVTTEGTVGQKIAVGISTGVITTVGTYLGAGIDTSGFDTFGTAVANYATTIFVGSITEPVAVAIQQEITNDVPFATNWNGGYVTARDMGLNLRACAATMA